MKSKSSTNRRTPSQAGGKATEPVSCVAAKPVPCPRLRWAFLGDYTASPRYRDPGPRLQAVAFCLLLFLSGCPQPDSSTDKKPTQKPFEGVKLQLLVVDDPELSSAIDRLARDEWTAQTGAELVIIQTTEKNLADAASLSVDAVICPSHMLGSLAERSLLAPVPLKMLRSPQWGEVFELLRLREAAWGNKIIAVPFGSPVFCCYYRADLLEKLGRKPPQTWTEYEELAKLLAEKGKEERGEGTDNPYWSGTIEPLAPGWAGLTLLARAASYAKHRDNFSTLFNIDTMEPMVAGPPFVQALEDLVAAAKFGPADPLKYDPTTARQAFWQGCCGLALTWPTAADPSKQEDREQKAAETPAASAINVGFVELPGSPRVFNLSGRVWDNRSEDDQSRVPLVSVAGRLGVVSKASPQIEAAFQLLLWLSDDRMSPTICTASPTTTLFRQSHLKSPKPWVEKPISPTASFQYADATAAALRHEQWLGALRMPGRAEYLGALDTAVAAAIRGEKSPMDALIEAEAQWRKITEQLGVDQQKAAYHHSLGLE